MGPTSPLWVGGPLVVAAALIVLAARRGRRLLLLRVGSGALALTLAMVAGVAVVNDYYGYYRSWGAVAADFGTGPNYVAAPAAGAGLARLSGTLQYVTIPGPHLQRRAIVYLPPQYSQRAAAGVQFPVLELLHGSPGQPSDWVDGLHVATVMNALLSRHQIGPMVLVMPSINGAHDYEDCVNGPLAQDETYIADDVPAWVRAHYRVSAVPADYGLAGFSSGGYCAANLALRHPDQFGAAAVLDGYFRAQDGPAGAALGAHPAALLANSPLALAARLTPGRSPLPPFWVMAGTGAPGDVHAAQAFVTELDRAEQVPFLEAPGAGHNYYAWQAALPSALVWLWRQVADPQLRVRYPTLAPPRSPLESATVL